MKQLFRQTEGAFLLAAVFGVLGWLVTHFASRLTDAPFLRYQERTEQSSDGWHTRKPLDETTAIRYELRNLTHNRVFLNLRFLVDAEGDATLLGDVTEDDEWPQIVADESITLLNTKIDKPKGNKSVVFWISQLHPGRGVTLVVFKKGSGKTTLRMEVADSNGKPLPFAEVTPVLFERASVWTWIVERELPILLILAFVGVVLAAVYLCYLARVPMTQESGGCDSQAK